MQLFGPIEGRPTRPRFTEANPLAGRCRNREVPKAKNRTGTRRKKKRGRGEVGGREEEGGEVGKPVARAIYNPASNGARLLKSHQSDIESRAACRQNVPAYTARTR